MTTDEILKMKSGYELDNLVAHRVMGWTLRAEDGIYVLDPKDDSIFGSMWGVSNDAPMAWEPSENMFPTWTMEEHLLSLNLHLRYTQALCVVFLHDGPLPERDEQANWQFIHATPHQRCRAALLTVNSVPNIQYR